MRVLFCESRGAQVSLGKLERADRCPDRILVGDTHGDWVVAAAGRPCARDRDRGLAGVCHHAAVENEARGNASRFEQVLAQYQQAPEVTRNRMYLDMQEQILSNVSKVIVDQKNGNSLLYLPLDKLLNPAATPAQGAGAPTAAPAAAANLPELDPNTQRSREAFRSRDRESR